MTPGKMLIAAATIGLSTNAMADLAQIELDLADVFYWGSSVDAFDTENSSAGAENAGAKIVSIEWTGLALETFNNIGLPNYGSEAMIGLEATTESGGSEEIWFFPFPNANYQGTVDNPIEQPAGEGFSFDLTQFDLELDVNGSIAALVTNAWDDGAATASGQWLSGTVIVNYEAVVIPAPGVLGLLGLAGLAGTSRRRRR
ncbi:MAG: PEP-CTERM sorting domain-containing protein [Phycisphaerales bacterium]|nr:PEP-CTERM sorting domain-containing protein [Phycisphaerales bacterium]|tara:strand:- start:4035 stop:4634 length:600 start_codon:yes stop_codon:yes gene_type:complete